MIAGFPVEEYYRTYRSLALLWLLAVLPMTCLAISLLQEAFMDARLAGGYDALPLLTRWYRVLGVPGMYLISLLPPLLFMFLLPFHGRAFAVRLLVLSLAAGIYFAFGGVVAACIAYVKLCV